MDQYTCIELTLSGKDLSAKEKQKAFEFFLARKVLQGELVSSDYQGAFRLSYYTKSSWHAEKLAQQFAHLHPSKLHLKTKILGWHDWFDKWKLDYHIRSLGSKFMIVPVWEKAKFKPCRRIPIYLEPGSAFGSGYHETTRLMVKLLESFEGKIKDFLDIGTGTGILAVIASKLGAEKVAAFDNDKPSVIAARKNFNRNGCRNGKFFGANLKRLKLKERFDVVGANLLSKELLENRKQIVSRIRSGGLLLVSGIALQNLAGFQKEFKSSCLKCLKILRGRKWAALLYKKGTG